VYIEVKLILLCFRLSAFAVVVNPSLSSRLAFIILVRRRMHKDVRLNGHALFTGPSVFGDVSLSPALTYLPVLRACFVIPS